MNRNAWSGDVGPAIEPASAEVVDGLAGFSAAGLADALEATMVMDNGMRHLAGRDDFCGSAVTVTVRPGSLLYVLKAFEFVGPGHVLVIDGRGRMDSALVGDHMAAKLAFQGAAAIVVDGAVRDLRELDAIGLPVFARGATPAAHRLMLGPGAVNHPVSCGGIAVAPGDVVRGDRDGIVVVPREWAARVLDRATAAAARDVAAGAPLDRPFSNAPRVDAELAAWREAHPDA